MGFPIQLLDKHQIFIEDMPHNQFVHECTQNMITQDAVAVPAALSGERQNSTVQAGSGSSSGADTSDPKSEFQLADGVVGKDVLRWTSWIQD